MKAKIITAVLFGLVLSACSKNESNSNTQPADYAETRDALIQNRANDSLAGDSIDSANGPTAMPPQEKRPDTEP
ncbi:hypothetical protein OA84_07305 [Kaistella solincola]|uniref:Lipoprotein n=1 Tax=Kaistella solincola TaxID=510955 RepID=A0ABR4ZQK6_9FLAO|nr:hypothetical protein [Kaistella solincola]KIA83332.1 hypothetical protein OA84_07305 [Kaistella solincola]